MARSKLNVRKTTDLERQREFIAFICKFSLPGFVSDWAVLVSVVETDEMILWEFNIAQRSRLLCPSVDQISQAMPEARHLQWTGLGVVREESEVHLTLGSHRQSLGVGHAPVRSHSGTLALCNNVTCNAMHIFLQEILIMPGPNSWKLIQSDHKTLKKSVWATKKDTQIYHSAYNLSAAAADLMNLLGTATLWR